MIYKPEFVFTADVILFLVFVLEEISFMHEVKKIFSHD